MESWLLRFFVLLTAFVLGAVIVGVVRLRQAPDCLNLDSYPANSQLKIHSKKTGNQFVVNICPR